MNQKTLVPLCKRCLALADKLEDPVKKVRVKGLVTTLLANPQWPDFKIGTWLGCAETILIEAGISTYQAERDFSRPIKHAYYREIGEEIPETTDVMRPKNE